jgi:hypothetical protein
MLISQSECDAHSNCERKHYYSFGEPTTLGRGIEPVKHGEGLSKGLLGHGAIEKYWLLRMEGSDHNNAAEIALMELMMKQSDPQVAEYVVPLIPIVGQYFVIYEDDLEEWEPLAIEREFRLQVSDELEFPFKVDGIFRQRSTKKIYVWDHKFLWNYYQPRSLKMMPQLPKYIYALRQLNYDVEDGMYNMISTRPNSKEPVRRALTGVTQAKARAFFREQIMVMQRIYAKKQLSDDEWRNSIVRTASSFNCTNCMFLDLCTSDLEGLPGRKLMLESFYRPNTYGYDKEEETV